MLIYSYIINIYITGGYIMTRTIATKSGELWKVSGINIIPSDSIYQAIEDILNSGKITQTALQGATGHRAPVIVDKEKRTISFERF